MAIRGRGASFSPIVARTLNTTLGIRRTSNSGDVFTSDSLNGAGYAACRNNTGGVSINVSSASSISVGQNGIADIDFGTVYEYSEGFIEFDTSGWTGTVTAATITLNTYGNGTNTTFVVEAYAFNYATPVTTANFVASASLPAVGSLLASATIPTQTAPYGTVALTSTAGMAAAVNVGGKTRFLLITDGMRLGTTPTQASYSLLINNATLNLTISNYQPSVTGSGTPTEARDTSAGSGTVTAGTITGTVASTERRDTSTATGTLTDAGTVASTERRDTSTATGTLTDSGTIASTETRDTSVATGTLANAGNTNVTERRDTATATSSVTDTGAVVRTERQDASTATGTLTISGSVAKTETRDVSGASGVTTISGSIASTEIHDAMVALGSVAGVVNGIVNVTERKDTSAGIGNVNNNGVVAGTNRNDQASSAGTIIAAGTVVSVERHDLASSGVVIVATGTPIERRDFAAAAGTVVVVATGTLVNRDDLAASVGSVIVVVTGTPVDRHDTASGGYIVATYGPLARWGEPTSVIYLEPSEMSGKEPAGVATVEPTVAVYRQPQGVQ